MTVLASGSVADLGTAVAMFPISCCAFDHDQGHLSSEEDAGSRCLPLGPTLLVKMQALESNEGGCPT